MIEANETTLRRRLRQTADGIADEIRVFGGDVKFDGFGRDEGELIAYVAASWTSLADGKRVEADVEVAENTISVVAHSEKTEDGRTPIHDYPIADFSITALTGLTVTPYRRPTPAPAA